MRCASCRKFHLICHPALRRNHLMCRLFPPPKHTHTHTHTYTNKHTHKYIYLTYLSSSSLPPPIHRVSISCAHLHPKFGEKTAKEILAEMEKEDEEDGPPEDVDVNYEEMKKRRQEARQAPYPTIVLEVMASPPPNFNQSPPPVRRRRPSYRRVRSTASLVPMCRSWKPSSVSLPQRTIPRVKPTRRRRSLTMTRRPFGTRSGR